MKRLIAAACLAAAATLPAQAELDDADRVEINEMIRAYILNNPEIIVEAMQVLEQRQQNSAAEADRANIAANRANIFDDGFSHARGPEDADVTIVEFFDYRCPYCHEAHKELQALLAADPKIRVIYKEFPILGPDSTFASRAAIAALRSDPALYEGFSDALLENKGPLDEKRVMEIAGGLGIDEETLRADMKDESIASNIRQTYALARELGINGTPGFVIGDQIVRSYLTRDQLQAMIAAIREQG